MNTVPVAKLRSRNSAGRTKGLSAVKRMDEEKIKGGTRDNRFDDDLAGAEPILDFTAVEHELQRAHREAQRTEPEPVKLTAGVSLGIGQEDHHAEQRHDADRQIDVEHVAPRIVLGQPAADDRAEHRPDHHAHAEQRHGKTLALARVGVEQDGL